MAFFLVFFAIWSRFRVAEVSFTLQGLTTLISALKKIPSNKGNGGCLSAKEGREWMRSKLQLWANFQIETSSFSFVSISFALTVSQVSWEQLIGLYPHLVELTASDSAHIGRSLRDALRQYSDLLRPPASTTVAVNGTP